MYFDCVEEREENGSFYVVAVDVQSERAYVVSSNAVINTSVSGFDGFKLAIVVGADKYVFRGELKSKEEMNEFSKRIGRLIMGADYKTNSIHRL